METDRTATGGDELKERACALALICRLGRASSNLSLAESAAAAASATPNASTTTTRAKTDELLAECVDDCEHVLTRDPQSIQALRLRGRVAGVRSERLDRIVDQVRELRYAMHD